MMWQEGMQAGSLPDVGLDHNIVVEEVEQERYWENIQALVNAGEWVSLLRILCQDRDSTWRSNIAQLLQPMNSSKNTIVHLAASDGQVVVVHELLLLIKDNQELWRERQANIFGDNPLHLAAFKGNEDTCKCLVDMAPDLAKAKNKQGNTPLHLAATMGHEDTCKCIAEMAPETAKATDEDGNTPLHIAALRGYKRVFDTITSMFQDDPGIALARKKDGDTILHCAISGENFDLASDIIDKHKELIGKRNNRGLTPLHLLANNPSAFKSGCRLGLLERFFYSMLKVSTESKSDDLKHQKREEHTFKIPGQMLYERGTSGRINQTWEPLADVIAGLALIPSACLLAVGALIAVCLYIPAIFGFAWWRWIDVVPKIWWKKHKHKWVEKVVKQLVHNIDHWSEFGKNSTGMDPYKDHLEWMRGINTAIEEIPSFAPQQEIKIASEPATNFMQESQIIHTTGDQPQQDRRTHSSPNELKEDNKRGMIESPFLIATKKGVIEMVEEIFFKFPIAIDDIDLEGKNIMQLAAEHRQHEIFKFVQYRIYEKSESLLGKVDAEGNSVLHLAAKYPQGQPVLIPGAASQMYYEYTWFKFVQTKTPPHFSNQLNHKGETAMEVFITTHQELAMERAKWLRNASQSCSVVAALITTVAFATISTMPGGLQQENGSPVFQGRDNFNTFSVSSFIAFCFSALSLIMFLGILFFPNQDLDFGNDRHTNLIWGINSLFVSIVAMFLSFFFGDLFALDKKMKYLAYPTFALTFCMAISRSPIYSEITSQAAFYSEFPDFIVGGIPKRAYPNNLSF